ncbi:SDR family NAD(P)-dependent oxidoreductase [Sphingobium scionense]
MQCRRPHLSLQFARHAQAAVGQDARGQPDRALPAVAGGDPASAQGERRDRERGLLTAFIGEAYAAAYCASKAGLLNLTKAMAMEFQKQPIRINAVAPGGMITNIATNFRPPEGCDFELLKRFSGMRGTVEVDDVADMVALLASPAGRGFHGNCISIDAGITAG